MSRPAPFLFDLDGTLFDTLADIAASTNHVRAGCGLQPLPEAAVQECIGEGARTLLLRALRDLPEPPPPEAPFWDEAYARYAAHHEAECTRHVRPYPGVADHLRRLAAAGHPLAVVTNKPERFAVRIVRHLGFDALLPVVVGGDTLPRKKPDPLPLHHALQALGRPGEGTMVGDGETDLLAGRAAGLRTIGVLYGYRPAARLRAIGADGWWSRFGG